MFCNITIRCFLSHGGSPSHHGFQCENGLTLDYFLGYLQLRKSPNDQSVNSSNPITQFPKVDEFFWQQMFHWNSITQPILQTHKYLHVMFRIPKPKLVHLHAFRRFLKLGYPLSPMVSHAKSPVGTFSRSESWVGRCMASNFTYQNGELLGIILPFLWNQSVRHGKSTHF